ncbi:MAG: phosphoenolpyruvate--protein phosphotransferase [Candidatus Zixiibacteriota bacterium]
MGPAFVYRVSHGEPMQRRLNSDQDVEFEKERLDKALAAVGDSLRSLKKDARTSVGTAIGKIFDAQVMIVEDKAIISDVKSLIERERIGAESAFARVLGDAQRSIERSSDPYLREMASEVGSVAKRVINYLLGIDETIDRPLTSPVILLAATITPSDIVSLKRDCILGIVTETGGQTSHVALLAKSLNIPAVAGVGFDVRDVRPGTLVAVDGYEGTVVLEPDQGTVKFIERKKKRARSMWPKRFDSLREMPAVTTDNHRVQLLANIDLGGEVERVLKAGADGVGLFRTEYLFLVKGQYPTEQEQLTVYRDAVEKLDGRPLIVRTFDLGSDKALPNVEPEANPALGLRGIRLALKSPRTLDAQLRALLKASAFGPVWVMLPMITDVDELLTVRERWERLKLELGRKQISFNANTPLGIMVETPSAVYLADELAEHAQFFSIGSNDLIQYTLAVDRGNADVAHANQKWHPALWRQIRLVIEAGQKANRPVGLCGELANEPLATPFLLGMGIDSISCHPNSVPRLKDLIRSLSYAEIKKRTHELLSLTTMSDIKAFVEDCQKTWKR